MCIAAYRLLSQDVFGKKKRGKVRKVCNLMSQGSMYSAKKLEAAIKKVIRDALGTEPNDVPLRSSDDSGCKVYPTFTTLDIHNLHWDLFVDSFLKVCLYRELRQLDAPASSKLPIE